MSIKTPSSPGEILLEMFIKPLGISITEAAEALGVTRKTFSNLINGHSRMFSWAINNVTKVCRGRVSGLPIIENWRNNQRQFFGFIGHGFFSFLKVIIPNAKNIMPKSIG